MIVFKASAGVTPVSNVFIEKYMPSAKSPMFSVIYIYTLRHALSGLQISNGDIADKLGILESDVIKAWEYWAEQGIVRLYKSGNDSVVEFADLSESASVAETATAKEIRTCVEPVKPVYTASEIEEVLNTNPEMKQLIQAVEKIYAKPFSASDLSTVVGFSTWLGLPNEVIMVLFVHCSGKPMRYIETTACDWADKGINTAEAAEEYINTRYSNYKTIMTAFGIGGRNPGENEQRIMNDWLFKLKMPMELIKLACDRTLTKTGKVSFEYANGIISDWHKNKIFTLAEVEARDAAFKQKQASKVANTPTPSPNNNTVTAPKPQANVKPTRFVNYNQPTYSKEELAEVMKRKKRR
jgi:DnaD/phage-associated family protein